MTCKRLKDKVDRYFVILLGFCSQEKEKDKTAERSINDIGRVEYSWNEGKCVRMWEGNITNRGGVKNKWMTKWKGFIKINYFLNQHIQFSFIQNILTVLFKLK